MRRFYLLIRCLFGFILLSGCTDPAVTVRLEAIDSLMTDHSDSALTLLRQMEAGKDDWSKSLRMRHSLLTAKAQNKADYVFTSDSTAKELVDYFNHHGTANERMLAYYLLGRAYSDIGEAPHAVNSYMDAIAVADTTAYDLDFYTLGCAYSQMAEVFRKQLLLTNEIEARSLASKYLFRAYCPYHAIYNIDMSTGAYILLNKADSAEMLQKQVVKLYQYYGFTQAALRATRTLIHIYVESSDRLEEAKGLIDRFESEYEQFRESHILPPSERLFYYYKGRYYEKTGQLDSAELNYRKLQNPDSPPIFKEPLYKGLLSIFKARHQADSIAKYAQLFCEVNDSSIMLKDREITAQMAASYKYQHFQKELILQEIVTHRTNTLAIGLVFALILMACMFVYKRKVSIDKQHKIQEEYSNAIAKYQENQQSLEVLGNARKAVITNIQQELCDAQKTIADINTQYEDVVEENKALRQKIDEIERQSSVVRHLEHAREFRETDIVKRIYGFTRNPTARLSEDDLNRLTQAVGKYYPSLLHDLTHTKDITLLGKHVCMLVILNLRPGDIVNLMSISSQQVSNIRHNLNFALFNENTSRTLYKNLVRSYGVYTS